MYNLIRAVPTVLRAARSILPTVGQILKNPKTIASLVAPSAI